MITHLPGPDCLEWRFGHIRFVEQIRCAQTHEGGAKDDTIGVQHAARPERLFHNLHPFVDTFLRDLVKMGADNHACLPIEAVCDKAGETLPVAIGEVLKRDNRHDHVGVMSSEADERFEIELGTRSIVTTAQKSKLTSREP